MREVITSILLEFDLKKNTFFEGLSWFKFNNFGLALGMALKLYSNVCCFFFSLINDLIYSDVLKASDLNPVTEINLKYLKQTP